MSRISSMFFILALMVYYMPKFLGKKNKTFIKIHIACGIISTIAMGIAFVQAVGTTELLKYVGFTIIMLAITVTGYLIKKKSCVYRRLHIVATLLFFIYLVGIIVF